MNKKVFTKNRVFKAPVAVGRENITITLPKKVAEYLGLSDGKAEVHWAPVNGVIQISGNEPNATIPMMSLSENTFVPHEEHKEGKKEKELPEVAEEVHA